METYQIFRLASVPHFSKVAPQSRWETNAKHIDMGEWVKRTGIPDVPLNENASPLHTAFAIWSI